MQWCVQADRRHSRTSLTLYFLFRRVLFSSVMLYIDASEHFAIQVDYHWLQTKQTELYRLNLKGCRLHHTHRKDWKGTKRVLQVRYQVVGINNGLCFYIHISGTQGMIMSISFCANGFRFKQVSYELCHSLIYWYALIDNQIHRRPYFRVSNQSWSWNLIDCEKQSFVIH